MPDGSDQAHESAVADIGLAAAIFALDPSGLGGVLLRGRLGDARDAWINLVRKLLPDRANFRRLPLHVTDDRLIGGLDLAATLVAGRPVIETGVLAATDGGVLLIPSAERLPSAAAARIASVMDNGEVAVERDGLCQRHQTRFGVVALDEGLGDDERLPSSLADRLACHLWLDDIRISHVVTPFTCDDVAEASIRLVDVEVDQAAIEALCAVAAALGIASLNSPLLASRVARCNAALCGRECVCDEDVALAARLVLAPRAAFVPVTEDETEPPQTESEANNGDTEQETVSGEALLEDVVLAAAKAAIPPELLARLATRNGARARGLAASGSGARQQAPRRGRPAGTRRGKLGSGARLNILETLRAAAPWQRIRASAPDMRASNARRIVVKPEDFRILRLKDRRETVTVFVVDASGSSALHRLAEAKGAVELLLADCYVRRDQVALLSFGGRGVELLLPPTRSLTRAKRRLADLAGGGGTPLAEALEQTALLTQAIKRRRQTPVIVVLTDGQPNLARDGGTGRHIAVDDAVEAASGLRAAGVATLLIDTAPRAQPCAARIADALGAQYVPLPYADARTVSNEVKSRIGS